MRTVLKSLRDEWLAVIPSDKDGVFPLFRRSVHELRLSSKLRSLATCCRRVHEEEHRMAQERHGSVIRSVSLELERVGFDAYGRECA